ncbi:MAG: PhzF family phenazine biosynthesis protein, partial [Pseudomonadota bacterium]
AMADLPYHIYDVFTDTPYRGNPLAIVEEADGLTDAQMQAMAAEFNLSETIFVHPPADVANAAKVRIFTPRSELPFAGHPTIGCALHLAGGATGVVVLEEVAGRVPVNIVAVDGQFEATLTAPRIPEGGPVVLDPDLVAAAIGLEPRDLGPDAPAVFEGGPTFLYLAVTSDAALARARPTEPAWSALTTAAGTGDVYVYARGLGFDYDARMFAPVEGIDEDPATGAATAILAGQLLSEGHLADGTSTLRLRQGHAMGRESHLGLSVDVASGAITAIRVNGRAVRVASGRIIPPLA